MIKVTIFKKEGKIWSYQIKGHARYAESGKDIVCSAVSTAGQMTLLGLKDVLKVEVESDIQDGYMQVKVTDNFEYENVQVLMNTFEKTIENFAEQYFKYIKLEVRKDVY